MKVYLGLGSNIGDRLRNISIALDKIDSTERIVLLRTSKIYETDPVGNTSQPDFLNCAAEIETDLEPSELLEKILSIETEMGRERAVKWGPRNIDIDILLYGDMLIESDNLIIPHPLMHERVFVLAPLNDLIPSFVHPLLKETIGQLLKATGSAGIKKVMDLDA